MMLEQFLRLVGNFTNLPVRHMTRRLGLVGRAVRGALLRAFFLRDATRAGLGVCLTASLLAWPARGESPAGADVLFEAGRQALSRGDFDQACLKFRESQRLDPAVGTLLNLGKCEEERGQVASSWEFYVRALEQLGPDDRRRQYAQRKARELEASVPRLVVRVADEAPAGTTVRRNGKPMDGDVGKPVRLDPGEYTITVDAPKHEQNGYVIFLELGEVHELAVTPGPRLPEPEPKPMAPSVGSSSTRSLGSPSDDLAAPSPSPVVFWSTAGVGAASLIGGAVFGVLSYREWRTVQDRCEVNREPYGCYDDVGLDAQQRGKTFGIIGMTLGAVAVLSGGTFAYFALQPDSPLRVDVARGGASTQLRVSGSF